ncbi:hypothetical protein ACYOEI_16285 [Singulisphaera rosea]
MSKPMSVTTLMCSCGKRLKTTGMTPGKSGLCPNCGTRLRIPEAQRPASPLVEDEWNWEGNYELGEDEIRPPTRQGNRQLFKEPLDPWADSRDWAGAAIPDEPIVEFEGDTKTPDYGLGPEHVIPVRKPPEREQGSEAPLPLPSTTPTGDHSESSGRKTGRTNQEPQGGPGILYPLRAAEGLGMVAAIGVACWVMGTLVPEYCRSLMADAEALGTPTMGHLVVLITAIPTLVLSPFVLIYWLQYLSRVLVACSEGDSQPPRPPDRNFDGLLTGLSLWVIWIVLGLGVGLLPLAGYLGTTPNHSAGNPWILVGLAAVALPYTLMALLLTFLHSSPFAAKPWAVIGTIARMAPSFVILCLSVASIFATGTGAFALVYALRPSYFAIYVLASLACWSLAVWISIAAAHRLGAYFYRNRRRLKW